MQVQHILRSTLAFIALSGSYPLISASPLQPRQQSHNCTDIYAVFDSRCWAELGMVDFLNHPKTGWNATTKTCDTSADGVNCCLPNEKWSSCFLRLALGSTGHDCSLIDGLFCNFQFPAAGHVDPTLQPKYQYALKAIYAINDLFTSWYMASGTASNQASLFVQPIITEIDPQQKTMLSLSALLSATIAGLPYLTTRYMANVPGLSPIAQQASQALRSSLQEAPAVSKALWPLRTTNTKPIPIGDLTSTMTNLSNQVVTSLNAGLNLIMSDMPTFIAFASSGAYTDSNSLSIPPQVPGMDYALRTYIASSALSANGYIAQLTNHSTTQAQCLGNAHTDPALCADQRQSTWTDNSTSLSFSIGSDGTASESALPRILNNDWTTMEALFAGACACAEAGRFDGGDVVGFNATGWLDLACVSRLMECKGKGDRSVVGNIEDCPGRWAALSG